MFLCYNNYTERFIQVCMLTIWSTNSVSEGNGHYPPGVICNLDILVMGSTSQEHLQNLAVVLERLSQHGLKLLRRKV